mgnify:CR=1 FL=1
MKTLLYGGTFDPPHNGHIAAAKAAMERLALDKLLLIPTFIPPHKALPAGAASPQQRLDMAVLAAAELGKRAEVLDVELRRGGPSYSWETLCMMKEQYPEDEIFLLMGSDMFLTLQDWRESRQVMSMARIGAFSRMQGGEEAAFAALPDAYSHLYLCIAGELAAVICIHDPLRREAPAAVAALHRCGFANVVMMTGDNRRTAETVAAEVGVDAVYAEVLPEDKAAFIRQEKANGHTVIMVGDGVNDSPALSEADAGIAISTGAAIAREIADITVASEDLFALVTLRRLGEALMERIHGSYRFIVGFNLTLIALGVAGVLPPATSALLHNGSTLGISLRNMTDLLDDEENPRK